MTSAPSYSAASRGGLLAVDRDGQIGVERDADHREEVVDGGASGHRVGLRPVGAARQESTQVGEEGDR